MPELPEVETIVRGLGPVLRGREITGVWGSGFGLRLARPVDLRGLRDVSVGRVFTDVRRRGKYITVVTATKGTAQRGRRKRASRAPPTRACAFTSA